MTHSDGNHPDYPKFSPLIPFLVRRSGGFRSSAGLDGYLEQHPNASGLPERVLVTTTRLISSSC